MRVIVVGASGRVGSEVVRALGQNHEIVTAGRSSGDLTVDYTDPDSVREMFEALGTFDALVATVGGDSVFKPYEELQDDDFRYGFERKILGQLRLLRMGAPSAADGASFTLSTGYLSDYPNPWSLATGPLNAALDTLVRNVAPILSRGMRVNVVSSAPVVEPGMEGPGQVTAAETARGYVESIEGDFTGRVIRVWGGLEPQPQ
jgi:NAD(P)-dependent dehydrogenase (short-subunit alcohol dehydrogenase family)